MTAVFSVDYFDGIMQRARGGTTFRVLCMGCGVEHLDDEGNESVDIELPSEVHFWEPGLRTRE